MITYVITYAECVMCCATCSNGDDHKAETWAEKHEDATGHIVKVHYMGERT